VDLAQLDATAQAELVRTGEASPRELVEAAVERIERLNPELNAVITPLFDKALDAADGELADGPFRGVPMVLKDLICHSAGDPFHEGMAFLKQLGWTEQEDTWLARRFREAGFVFLGKTNTPELGILPTTEPEAHGATRNPWDRECSPGGSSGGSAAAVAAGLVPVAHANDGGGSIRIPASACGLVGLKASRGRVSQAPDFGDVMTGLVTELVVSRSVRDTAAILEWVSDPPPGEPYVAPARNRPYTDEVGSDPGRLRVGLMTRAPGGQIEVHPDCVTAAEEAGRLLESLGHSVEDSYPAALDDEQYVPLFLVRWTAGIAWNLAYWSGKTGRAIGPDDVEPSTWALAQAAREHSGADYLRALEHHQTVARRAADWWAEGFDLLLTPTMGEPPTPLGAFEPPADDPTFPIQRAVPPAIFTAAFNSTGQPAISLPLHWNSEGLPIGVQLVAAYGREDLLIGVAARLEEARPWSERTPPLLTAR
jgi:amidase